MPAATHRLSPHCWSCQQLRTVDLSQTDVIEILGSTFAHCSQLQQLSLSRNLRIIEQEAFLKCTSLQEVCIPPSLLYIARRAFAGCTQLRAVRKQGKSKTWRGTYARLNAFDKRPNGSDSCRQMPMTNGETTSKQPHAKLAKQMTVGMDCYSAVSIL